MGLLQLRSRAPAAQPQAGPIARLVTAAEAPKLVVSNCRVKPFEDSAGAGSDGAVTGSIAKWSEQGRMKELHPVVAAPKLSRKLGDQKPELDSRAQELTTKRLASATQVKSSTATVGKALQQIAAIDSTYHAPATVTAPRTVTVKGAAQDGSGRTVTLSFTLQAPPPEKLLTPPNKRLRE